MIYPKIIFFAFLAIIVGASAYSIYYDSYDDTCVKEQYCFQSQWIVFGVHRVDVSCTDPDHQSDSRCVK